MQLVSDLVLVAVLVVAAVTDVRSGRIYNRLVYPAIALGLAFGAAGGGLAGLKDHALGAGIGFGVLLVCYALGGMGGGDVKLMAAVGALGGFERGDQGSYFILYALFYAFAVGVILGLLAAMWKRVLGPVATRTWWGARMLVVPGTSLDDAVPKTSVRVPFGLATCLGTLWLLIENYSGASLGALVARLF
jgi:prepilin peptidase CpaA